ncbi:LysR family transcriptional regulator [Geomesophilobacter sediminis]|uniref:LysR family transcriptional regulator n=1 Tax=Geomesophilobacter sediminis TaxID=2798584 RepID=A0A8J7J6Q4_9BACT|nr:LysR family transcriptional regulator [Geomesophilobacter sediminis]MBJ6724541.1 LysR family transcriptional regulator [Geomesophilobacter sediminis]
MSLRNLRILIAVARKGSFAAAAEQLGLTDSAVSLQMKKMEEEFGATLFERSGRSPRLNASGRQVLERAQEIVALYDGIKAELTPEGMVRGVLALGVVPTVITGPLPPVLRRLRDRYPELNVRLHSALSVELSRLVDEGDLDAALITEPPVAVPEGAEWREYDVEPFFVAAPAGIGAPSVEELFDRFPFVRFDKTAWAGAMVDGQLMARGIHPRDVMELNSIEAALGFVEQGLGISVVPLNRQRVLEAQRRFTLIPFGDPPLVRRVGLYRKSRQPRRMLTDLLLEELSRACGLSRNT